jgi:hypothetical protein
MARANQTFTPVTFGYLRREPKWLHLYCTALAKRRPAYTSLPLRKEADVIARRYDVSCGSAADLNIGGLRVCYGPRADVGHRIRS